MFYCRQENRNQTNVNTVRKLITRKHNVLSGINRCQPDVFVQIWCQGMSFMPRLGSLSLVVQRPLGVRNSSYALGFGVFLFFFLEVLKPAELRAGAGLLMLQMALFTADSASYWG